MTPESWTCSTCAVTVRFGNGAGTPTQPEGWAQENGSWFCLGCRRAEVVSAASDGDAAGHSARRREALTQFELLRDPDAPDHVIAKRVNCATRFVGPIRADLEGEGKLAASPE